MGKDNRIFLFVLAGLAITFFAAYTAVPTWDGAHVRGPSVIHSAAAASVDEPVELSGLHTIAFDEIEIPKPIRLLRLNDDPSFNPRMNVDSSVQELVNLVRRPAQAVRIATGTKND